MSKRVSPTFIVPAILGAALAAYLLADHGSATAASAPVAPVAAANAPASSASPAAGGQLPPNHPSVPGMPQHGVHGGAPAANGASEPASIEWKTPGDWQTLPNPNPMRIATYRAGEGAEVSVARAGGPVDANILRWSQQFAGAPQPERSEKQVHGIHVTVVHVAGTYQGSGMGMSAPETHEGWAMLAAIVEGPGVPYFFKLLGPAPQVDKARASFDSLLASVAPVAAK